MSACASLPAFSTVSQTDVCRAFGIARKTGYKLFARYKEDGPVALADRSRRPMCPSRNGRLPQMYSWVDSVRYLQQYPRATRFDLDLASGVIRYLPSGG